MHLFLLIIVAIAFIVIATVRFKLHPFFSLFLAALGTGVFAGLGLDKTLQTLVEGFGDTLSSIGFIIVFGTVIGIVLERTKSTEVLVGYMLKWFGEKRSALAMNLTGFVVSIPVFCDSAFVILSSLNRTLSRRTARPMIVFSIALATGLYAAHVFVPPTPGPLAAAALLNADLGSVLIFGLFVALPVSLVGFLWSRRLRSADAETSDHQDNTDSVKTKDLPGSMLVFLPILVPIVLIALKTIANYPTHPFGETKVYTVLDFIGHPITALFVGVILAFVLSLKIKDADRLGWTSDALKEAGVIILITGAGGAFGAVLRALELERYLNFESDSGLVGIILAWSVAAILKTAQGSSTVALVTASAFMAPLLGSIGLDSEMGRTLTVLAVGAGAMTISHLNDSYFWVVSQFSDLSVKSALRNYTMATFIQGITGLLIVIAIHLLFN